MKYNQETIHLINSLKSQLQNPTNGFDDPIAKSLNGAIDHIINIYLLDQDPLNFASIPIFHPPKIEARTTYLGEDFLKFYNSVYNYIPEYKSISISQLINRCLANSITTRDLTSDIKSAILSLKEDGLIEIDDNNLIRKIK